ncbi:hypothetical protein GOBAR_DD22374 [Gossypium barbadense]|nr:hypothetical protein GOBAR_DD22374 [Gossypium barbadense]
MGQLLEFPENNAIQSLSLYLTNFSGKLPESIGNLKFLTNLDLYDCNFFGPIPSSIANLSHLVNLDLRSNKLSGSIHSSLFTLPSLKILYLGDNQLVGKIDEFPNTSSSLIQELYIGDNYLTGTIPKSILQLPRLEGLYIGGNSFNSMKLDMFVQLNNLRTLWLNNISLLIESDSRSITFPQLESLWLRSCNLTEFPKFIKRQDKLVDLDLSNNHILGVVPNWLWKSSLSSLHLSFNVIDFPKQLPLSGNKLEGKLSRSLANCKALEVLDLGNNMVHDTFPFWLEKLPSLRVLILRANRFYGTITEFNTERGFPKLRILDLGSNYFSGYASGLVVGLCIGYTGLNELGNKWVDRLKKHGKRNKRRSCNIVIRFSVSSNFMLPFRNAEGSGVKGGPIGSGFSAVRHLFSY